MAVRLHAQFECRKSCLGLPQWRTGNFGKTKMKVHRLNFNLILATQNKFIRVISLKCATEQLRMFMMKNMCIRTPAEWFVNNILKCVKELDLSDLSECSLFDTMKKTFPDKTVLLKANLCVTTIILFSSVFTRKYTSTRRSNLRNYKLWLHHNKINCVFKQNCSCFINDNANKHLHFRCFDLTPNRLKLGTANLVLGHPLAVLLTPVSSFPLAPLSLLSLPCQS